MHLPKLLESLALSLISNLVFATIWTLFVFIYCFLSYSLCSLLYLIRALYGPWSIVDDCSAVKLFLIGCTLAKTKCLVDSWYYPKPFEHIKTYSLPLISVHLYFSKPMLMFPCIFDTSFYLPYPKGCLRYCAWHLETSLV